MNDTPEPSADESDEDVRELIDRLHAEAPLTDAHAHPSMKSYLFERDLWTHRKSDWNLDPDASRSDFRVLQEGGVRVVWTAHYVIEDKFVEDAWDCAPLRLFAQLYFQNHGIDIFEKLRAGSPYERLQLIMQTLEDEAAKEPPDGLLPIAFAKNPAQVGQILAAGKCAFVHTVEGSHALQHPGTDPLENLEQLAQRGVAMLTLNHFYWNGYAEQTNALPDSMPCRRAFKTDDAEAILTDEGKALLAKLKEMGIVADLAHCSPAARDAIYAEVGGSMPLVFSHGAVQHLRNKPYNLREPDIDAIKDSGGAIGVIFMSYWLGEDQQRVEVRGAEAVWRNVKFIHQRTDSWDYVMIGTDFDGFTDPPDDLIDASFMWRVTLRLIWGMKHDLGMGDAAIEDAIRKILGGNAQRVLNAGWTGVTA